ncbi:MAG: hypothetical protein JEZ03_17395, partial [Bacteroidales bacterium]|nr:hypothetical protein [Bacteroidales bacterium]
IRYVLLIVDKFAGAKNLIEEMDIINVRPVKKCYSTKPCCDKAKACTDKESTAEKTVETK